MKGLLRALKATKGVEVMTSTRLTAVIKDEKMRTLPESKPSRVVARS